MPRPQVDHREVLWDGRFLTLHAHWQPDVNLLLPAEPLSRLRVLPKQIVRFDGLLWVGTEEGCEVVLPGDCITSNSRGELCVRRAYNVRRSHNHRQLTA